MRILVAANVIALSLLFVPPPAAAAGLSAGVAEVEITPPVGYRMSGYFSERFAAGAHDPLKAKALYLRQGDAQAALVFCDMIGVSLDVSQRARKATAAGKIPAENILIAATHSHTGPLYFGALREHLHAQAVANGGKDTAETVDYSSFLVERIAAAIAKAKAAAVPATLHAGIGEQLGLSFNRRFHMKDGTVRFNPGKLNPNIVRVAGPIDPDVGLLLLKDAKTGGALSALTVFALHLDTVGGTEYSADFPHYLARSLAETYGDGFVSLFGAGTCGDINHVDVSHKRPQKSQQEAGRIGKTLAQTVLAKLAALDEPVQPSLSAARTIVDAPLQQFGRDQIARAKNNMHKIGTRDLSFLEQVEAYKIVAVQQRPGKTLPMEVQVFRLSGDAAVVGLPGEVFVDLGLAIKQASPFTTTIVIELCNDAPAYVPTRKAFAEGSYETVNSRIQPGSGEKLVQAAVKLLNQLHAESN